VAAIAYAPGSTMTRRSVLVGGGAAALAAVAAAGGTRLPRIVDALGGPTVPAYLRRSSFTGLVGDRFELGAGNARTGARLIAFDDLGSGPRMRALAGSDDAFALVFRDQSGRPRLDQDDMTLSHAKLGRFRLLVTPVGRARGGQDYVAVINRAPVPRRRGGIHGRAVPR
jgi:hypothetical protein